MGSPLLQISMLAPGSLRRRDDMFSGWIPLLVGAALPAGLVACLRGAGCTIVAQPSFRLPLCGLRTYLWRTSGVPLAYLWLLMGQPWLAVSVWAPPGHSTIKQVVFRSFHAKISRTVHRE